MIKRFLQEKLTKDRKKCIPMFGMLEMVSEEKISWRVKI